MGYNLSAYLANRVWSLANLSSAFRFERSLSHPATAQREKLARYLGQNADTAFGLAHRFASIRSYEDFAARVPISTYEDMAPWMDRIRRGEHGILTRAKVTHFAPTSGTSSGCKLIPFTRELQSEFSGAVGVWMSDLFRKYPAIRGGRAYWSITPVTQLTQKAKSVVPIGFEEDSEYLGGFSRLVVDQLMAVPGKVRQAKSMEAFWYETSVALLRCEDLRLISVWHPSFLTILWDYIQSEKKMFGARVRNSLKETWPDLRLVSCWGDAAAEEPFCKLSHANPDIGFQRKGLIATEGLMSIPYAGGWPLAIDAHFFEFIDGNGTLLLADSLRDGEEYEIVLTSAGGLWRYKIGDRIRVEGFVEKTPSIRFIGRESVVSDLFGEKLSEQFVAGVLKELAGGSAFAMLAPDGDRYTLYVEGAAPDALALDDALSANPHYKYCRELEQLKRCRVQPIARGHASFIRRMTDLGLRIGDIKPALLSKLAGWGDWFD